jgi:hypothetical protein
MKYDERTLVRVSDISLCPVCESTYIYWHFPGYEIGDECELKIKIELHKICILVLYNIDMICYIY